jgi:hypothetical protein
MDCVHFWMRCTSHSPKQVANGIQMQEVGGECKLFLKIVEESTLGLWCGVDSILTLVLVGKWRTGLMVRFFALYTG